MIKKTIYFILFLQPFLLRADIIYLKNGKTLKGKISRQTLTKVELILPDNKIIVIEKNEIQKIRYISPTDQELKEKQRQEELKRIQEEKKRKEEEQKKIEEERQRLEKEKELEELKRLEEEKKRKEEELKQLEEIQKKYEEEQRKLIEEQKKLEIETLPKEIQKYKIQYQFGGGIGTFNLPLNQFYKYYNFFTEYSQNNLKNYIQNIQIQMKSLPDWNWSGNIHGSISLFYKNWEIGFLNTTMYQKPIPKSLSIPNKLYTNLNEPQYQSYSDVSFKQKMYQNSLNKIFLRMETEEYFPYFWYYIFPYFEIGIINRNFQYNAASKSTLLTSKRNTITNEFEFSNLINTENIIKNHLQQNAFSIGIPFRFLMIFSSEFLWEFHYFLYGQSKLNQDIRETNVINNLLSNTLLINSEFIGNFSGNIVSFIWQNTFSSNDSFKKIAYIRFNKVEYKTKFKNIEGKSTLIYPQIEYTFFNEVLLSPFSLLYQKDGFKSIKENSFFFEFGIKLNHSL
jgi:hypothetical protein